MSLLAAVLDQCDNSCEPLLDSADINFPLLRDLNPFKFLVTKPKQKRLHHKAENIGFI